MLCQDNDTRWNSKYKMVKRFLELKAALIPTLALRLPDIQISNADWTLMEKVCNCNQGYVCTYISDFEMFFLQNLGCSFSSIF